MSNRDQAAAAIAKVAGNHGESVAAVVAVIANRLAPTKERFTADDVYFYLSEPLSSPFAMGAGFRIASRNGLIRKLDLASIPSRRSENNGHPLPFWVGI